MQSSPNNQIQVVIQGPPSRLTQEQIAREVSRHAQRERERQPQQAPLEWQMIELMHNLSAQIQALTASVTALTAAIQENTEAMVMPEEEEEAVKKEGFLGWATVGEPPAPHL